MTADAKARLRRTLLAMAADAMSGPGGLAAYLRSRLLGAPYSGMSLPLDVGRARDIPDQLRRAVILRDKHCGWPGGCDVGPAGSEVHHLVPWSEGGKTSIDDLKLFCKFHHQVCIHRRGWKVIMHPDGTTEAISPYGEILRSHGPPGDRTAL
jgi:HNH endonuclease